MKRAIILFVTVFLLFFSANAFAVPIAWTDWTSATSTSAEGNIAGMGISYQGLLKFSQLGSGTNYWTEGSPAPYTGSALVDNAPTASELLALDKSTTNTITFGQTVSNPLMAIVSQGRLSLPVTYDFDTPFVVLSEGRGYWGDGSYTLGAGDVLNGYELHGVIQFQGDISSISWTSTEEYWHGFTFGLADTASVPEPGTIILLGAGLVGLAGFGRKKLFKK